MSQLQTQRTALINCMVDAPVNLIVTDDQTEGIPIKHCMRLRWKIRLVQCEPQEYVFKLCLIEKNKNVWCQSLRFSWELDVGG